MLVAFFLCVCAVAAVTTINVVTQHYDIQRSGTNQHETTLSPHNVKNATFGLLWKTQLNAPVSGQVLIVQNVNINGTGKLYETAFAWTSANAAGSVSSAYALDAKTGNILWTRPFNITANYATASGTIDTVNSIWYIVTRDNVLLPGYSNYEYPHWLHALDLATGNEKPGSPIRIVGTVPATGPNPTAADCYNSAENAIDFTYCNSNVRPGLLLLNGNIYIGFAFNSDASPYHGWVFAYTYASGAFTRTAIWCVTPASKEGGVWQAGKGLASDGTYVYVTTGNGNYNTTQSEYGMSVVKLSATLGVVDYFTPHDWQAQSNSDLDMGNNGAILLKYPNGTTWASRAFVGPTKYGRSFVLNLNNLGQFNPTVDSAFQSWTTGNTNEVGANAVSWSDGYYTNIFTYEPSQQLNQLTFNGSAISNTASWPQAHPSFQGVNYTGRYGGLSTSGSGANTNGILWMVGTSGQFWALNASDITKAPYWTNGDSASRDGMPSGAHFAFPVVANGRAYSYSSTSDRSIYAYGLLCTFPTPLNNIQCFGLSSNPAANASACQAACCGISTCTIWQYWNHTGQYCWLGQSSDCRSSPNPWLGGGRY